MKRLASLLTLVAASACQHSTAPDACHLDTRPARVILTLWSQDDPPIKLHVDTLFVPDTTKVCSVTETQ